MNEWTRWADLLPVMPNLLFFTSVEPVCLHRWQAIFLSLTLVKLLLTLVATVLCMPRVKNVFLISLFHLSKTNDELASLSNHSSQPIFAESDWRMLGCSLFINLHSRLKWIKSNVWWIVQLSIIRHNTVAGVLERNHRLHWCGRQPVGHGWQQVSSSQPSIHVSINLYILHTQCQIGRVQTFVV